MKLSYHYLTTAAVMLEFKLKFYVISYVYIMKIFIHHIIVIAVMIK